MGVPLYILWGLGRILSSDSVESPNIFQTDFPLKTPLKIFLPGVVLKVCGKGPILL
jgi:hypothetical protein